MTSWAQASGFSPELAHPLYRAGGARRFTVGVSAKDGVDGAAFGALHERGDRQRWWVRDEQVRMVCSPKVSISPLDTGRRDLVTNARWACRADTLCRARRIGGLGCQSSAVRCGCAGA
jgi:hypothetical protein